MTPPTTAGTTSTAAARPRCPPSTPPALRPLRPQGTYLLWLDCQGRGLGDAALRRFFVEEARVGMNPGPVFGTGGEGFMRLNLGAPRSVVMAALERMHLALAGRRLAPALCREK